MKSLNRHFKKVVYSLVCCCCYHTAFARHNHPEDWHYLIAPYAWASSLSGDVTVRGRTSDVDISFLDLLKKLDFAAQGHFEISHGSWTFMFDPTYFKLSEETQQNAIAIKFSSRMILIDTGIFYRIFSYQNCAHFVSFELLGGSRHLGIKNTLDFNPPDILFSGDTNITTPIVGGRFKFNYSPNIQFWLRGDMGGFDVDDVSKTYSATAGLAYSMKKHIDLGLAYRVLKVKFNKTNAADLLLYGPMIGIIFHD